MVNSTTMNNNRDRDFFKFEEMSNQTIQKYWNDHPECKDTLDEGLESILSNLLIENVKIRVSEKGNIVKTLCGHKLTENRNKDKSLKGISLTLFGNYENKKRTYNDFSVFNEWYEKELNKCKGQLNKTTTTTEVEQTSPSGFGSVVLSIDGNDYCFEGLTGVKFVIKKNGDEGLKLGLERLVG